MMELLVANAVAVIATGMYVHLLHKRLGNAEMALVAVARGEAIIKLEDGVVSIKAK